MRIYTRTGDAGETSLRLGERVRKDDLRIEVSGSLDELCTWLGFACVAAGDPALTARLSRIQQDLFALSAAVADPQGHDASLEKVAFSSSKVAELERVIDETDASLPPLKQFILPGGTEAGARLHVARTVCRRAERRLTALAKEQAVPAVFLAYVNRLSDLLFVLARMANHRAGDPEIPW
jgi:cob(I)alamin adenosyltransferase